MIRDRAQFAWVLNFQRSQFKNELTDAQVKYYEEALAPIIDQNFRQSPSAGLAFAKMTGGLFTEVELNDGRIAALKRLDIPFQLIWGDKDPYLNTGVAQDLMAKLRNATLVTLSAGHWPQVDDPRGVAQAMLAAP